jgi:hypothetical protein
VMGKCISEFEYRNNFTIFILPPPSSPLQLRLPLACSQALHSATFLPLPPQPSQLWPLPPVPSSLPTFQQSTARALPWRALLSRLLALPLPLCPLLGFEPHQEIARSIQVPERALRLAL